MTICTNRADRVQTLQNVVSDQGQQCLLTVIPVQYAVKVKPFTRKTLKLGMFSSEMFRLDKVLCLKSVTGNICIVQIMQVQHSI